MTRKAPTLSEQAYRALNRARGKNKSAAKVIRRPTGKKANGSLLDYIRSVGPNDELASAIENVLEKRKFIRLRTAGRQERQRRLTPRRFHYRW